MAAIMSNTGATKEPVSAIHNEHTDDIGSDNPARPLAGRRVSLGFSARD